MRGTLRGGSYLLALASLALVSATVSDVRHYLNDRVFKCLKMLRDISNPV